MTESALYVGHITHARRAPRHSFRVPIYLHLIDLAELPMLESGMRLFGRNRARVVSFWDRDHLFDPCRAVHENLRELLAGEGFEIPIERVLLLTQCRVLGYVFNPVSFFYCLGTGDSLVAVVAEVHNTYGERHAYLLRPDGAAPGVFSGNEKKVFHVSPFMSLDGTYRFTFTPPGEIVDVGLHLRRAGTTTFTSRLTLRRAPFSDRALLGVLARYPLMPQVVSVGIYAQALRLWWAGATFRRKPVYNPAEARKDTAA